LLVSLIQKDVNLRALFAALLLILNLNNPPQRVSQATFGNSASMRGHHMITNANVNVNLIASANTRST